MFSRKSCAKIVAVTDLLLALSGGILASYQFSHGSALIHAPVSEGEKLTRLFFYSILVYIFVFVQIGMATKLLRSAIKMVENPIKAIRVFGWWREWSVVFLLTLLLHAGLVSTMMEFGQRKIICLVSLILQASFRPFGIVIIGSIKQNLEMELPTKL